MTVQVQGGRALARNAALNMAGQLLPLLLALPIFPYVLRGLGAERFAVLALAWTIIGYFGFLDLGLGRAATQRIATLLGEGRGEGVNRVVWSSLTIQAALGLAGAGLIGVLAPVIAGDLLGIQDPVLFSETRDALILVALGLPAVVLSGTLSGVLEAHQRFDLVNAVRAPTNAATLLVPAAGVALAGSLPAIVVGIVTARLCGLAAFAYFAARVSGGLHPERPHLATARRLLDYGGWLTVSLVAVPIFTYTERLLIGGLDSLTALAYYTIPLEIVGRTAIIPAGIAMTLFPAFSHAQADRRRIDELFRRPLRMLFLLEWPLLVLFWLFPRELLGVWMGPDVAAAAAPVMRLLAVAFFLNAFAQIALAGVHGLGRPDLKAKADLALAPAFVLLAAVLIPRFGIAGAAMAKLVVTIVDTTLLFAFANRLAERPLVRAAALRDPITAAGVLIVIGTLLSASLGGGARFIVAVGVTAALGAAVWRRGLEPADRAAVRSLVSRFLPAREVS